MEALVHELQKVELEASLSLRPVSLLEPLVLLPFLGIRQLDLWILRKYPVTLNHFPFLVRSSTKWYHVLLNFFVVGKELDLSEVLEPSFDLHLRHRASDAISVLIGL